LRDAEAEVDSTLTDFSQNTAGLYTLIPADGSISNAWLTGAMIAGPTTVLTYAGAPLTSVTLAQPPQYVVELLPPVAAPGDSLGNPGAYSSPQAPIQIFRITAQAVGGDGTATVTVQSVYR
jgi:Tfp pilus assembly protein PilX